MELYRYKAMDQMGRIRRGRLWAASLDELEAKARRLGLDLITFRTADTRGSRFLERGVPRHELINLCFQLEQLVGGGVPLVDALSDLRNTMEEGRFRDIVSAVIDGILEGKNLSDSLEGFPRVFDPVFVNVIRVGERSGKMTEVLRDLTEGLRWQDEFAARAMRTLTYPALLTIVIAGVTSFLMIYLVPQLAQFISGMKTELPVHTRALLTISGILANHIEEMFLFPLLVFTVVILIGYSSTAARVEIDRLKLKIWVVGDVLHKLILARFVRMFALMFRAGIPVLDILRQAGAFVGNKALEQAIHEVASLIARGEGISRSFEQAELFPPLVLRMISVGEKTGALDRALENVAYFYDRQVRERIDRLETLSGPIITVLLGALLGWIMLAVLDPIYEMVSRIGL